MMNTIDRVENFKATEIPIDIFWNTGHEKEHKIHKIHSYPAKFPAFITTKALKFIENKNLKVDTIADIFCGCGTTAFESKRNNINFWGCDINPVATLIAKVKSNKYQVKRLDDYFQKIKNYFINNKIKDEFDNANERLKYWYSKKQYNELKHLKEGMFKVVPKESRYIDFFQCAFSNILKPASMWLTKSIKPQYDPNKEPVEVLSSFEVQYLKMRNANNEINNFGDSKVQIVNSDFLKIQTNIPKIDLIITSPPYVTSYEYADLHQLSTLWLDFSNDYKELRQDTIGSLYHDYNFNKEIKRLNKTAYEIVTQLILKDKAKARSIAKYYLDMQKVINKTFDILSINGIALFVIGNTEYKNVRIDNTKHLIESMLTSGFKRISITKRKISNKILTPYRDKYGKFTINSKGRKVYSEEFIVIGEK